MNAFHTVFTVCLFGSSIRFPFQIPLRLLGRVVVCDLVSLLAACGIETFLDVQPPEFPRLRSELETAIFRVIQEAMTNVLRHSCAKNGWVTLKRQNGELIITVRDDGKGIAKGVAEFQSRSIGVGIGGMRQRIKELGGKLRLENTKPGTRVEVTIPSGSETIRGQTGDIALPIDPSG